MVTLSLSLSVSLSGLRAVKALRVFRRGELRDLSPGRSPTRVGMHELVGAALG